MQSCRVHAASHMHAEQIFTEHRLHEGQSAHAGHKLITCKALEEQHAAAAQIYVCKHM